MNGKKNGKEFENVEALRMDWTRRVALLVGALLIIDLVVNAIGSTLIEGLLEGNDYLTALAADRDRVMTGVLLETVCAMSLLAIGVLLYPVLRAYSGTVARGYLGVRIVETVIAVSFVVSHLMLFALGQDFVAAGAPEASSHQTLGALLIEGHDLSYQVYLMFYGLGCLLLFGAMFRARMVPRPLSVWGLAGVVIALGGLVADMFGSSVGMEVYAMPLGLGQVSLAIWLLVKGFYPPTVEGGSAPAPAVARASA